MILRTLLTPTLTLPHQGGGNFGTFYETIKVQGYRTAGGRGHAVAKTERETPPSIFLISYELAKVPCMTYMKHAGRAGRFRLGPGPGPHCV